MKISTTQKRTLILSLLLHLLLLILFIFQAFKNSPPFTLFKAEMPSALPSQGAEVFFDTSTIPPELKVTPIEEKLDEKNTPPPETPTALYPKKSDEGTGAYTDGGSDSPKEQPAPRAASTPVKEPIAQKEGVGFIKENDIPTAKNEETQLEKEEMVKCALSNLIKEPKKKTELSSSLSKCYIDHEKGNSCMLRYGVDRVPGAEELKYFCYEKEIEKHIVTNWRMLYGNAEFESPVKPASFHYVINEHGIVEDLRLMASSGSPMFDRMAFNCLQTTHFPPLPKHFGVKKYHPRSGLTYLTNSEPPF